MGTCRVTVAHLRKMYLIYKYLFYLSVAPFIELSQEVPMRKVCLSLSHLAIVAARAPNAAVCLISARSYHARCLINQTRAALASEIAPEPLVLYAAPILQLRQEHDVNKRPDEPRNNSCELDSA